MQSFVNMGQFILNHLEQRVYQIGIRLWIVWPWMTSNDLAFNFFEKTISEVSWRPKLIDFRKNDPHRSEIKFYSMIIFMTHSAVSYQKRIFRLKLRFDLKRHHLTLKFQDPRFNLSAIWILQVDFLEILNISRTRNENLINFSTAKNPNITFWTDPRKFKNHRVPFSFKPPLSLANVKKSCMQQCDSFEMFFENVVCLHATS